MVLLPAGKIAAGKLLQAFAELRAVAFEDGLEPARPGWPERFVQRLVAVRPAEDAATAPAARHLLS